MHWQGAETGLSKAQGPMRSSAGPKDNPLWSIPLDTYREQVGSYGLT